MVVSIQEGKLRFMFVFQTVDLTKGVAFKFVHLSQELLFFHGEAFLFDFELLGTLTILLSCFLILALFSL